MILKRKIKIIILRIKITTHSLPLHPTPYPHPKMKTVLDPQFSITSQKSLCFQRPNGT